MKAILVKTSLNGKDTFKTTWTGECLGLPEPGSCFLFFHQKTKCLQTSYVKSVTMLADGGVEFETQNSKYNLFEVGGMA